jgi:acid phosphatase family membrane protein YuiD
MALIQLILSAVSLGSAIVGGSFSTQGMSTIISLIFAILIMWIANNIKREAGK